MILKGSQRGDGADLAIHLMNGFENESIEIAEVYGTVAGDLYGAFAEFEAVSRGTKATEYLYSLSISPPKPLTRPQYYEAIAAIEHGLGLTDQPRAVVFHIKPDKVGIAREHCHVVWSRIDLQNMRAIHMSHDHSRLMDMACELAHKFGFELPDGLKKWEAKQKYEKDQLEANLAENAQAKETGITPEQRRADITAAYEQADGPEAFRAALEQKGYILARGDQRGFVVVDKFGDAHSLTRYVKGHKPSAVKKKLAPLTPEQLPSADEAKEMMRQRMQAQDDRQREQESKQQQDQQPGQSSDLSTKEKARKAWREASAERLREFRQREEERLGQRQAASRFQVHQVEQELLTRQQAERLALHAAQASESTGLLFRVRSAVADLIARTPGLRSVLAHIQKLTHLDPKGRHRLENEALSRRHARERLDIERRKRTQAHIEKRENQSLEKAVRRQERLEQEARLEIERTLEQAHTVDNKAMQDFYEVARDHGLWKHREFQEGELRENFNDAAEFQQGADDSGGDETHAPDPEASADDDDGDDNGPKHRPRRSKRKGYGYRRDSD